MKRQLTPRQQPFESFEEDIQKCVYFLWQEEGRPSGRDLDLWLSAKELVRHQVPDRPKRPEYPRRISV